MMVYLFTFSSLSECHMRDESNTNEILTHPCACIPPHTPVRPYVSLNSYPQVCAKAIRAPLPVMKDVAEPGEVAPNALSLGYMEFRDLGFRVHFTVDGFLGLGVYGLGVYGLRA